MDNYVVSILKDKFSRLRKSKHSCESVSDYYARKFLSRDEYVRASYKRVLDEDRNLRKYKKPTSIIDLLQ